MHHRDTKDVLTSAVAVIGDALAVFAGFMLAVWIRFDTQLIPIRDLPPPDYYAIYMRAAAIATILFLFIFKVRGLYVRPQIGPFGDKIPRLTNAIGLGIILSVALAFAM
ncbi:MAG: hypothetical protein HY343_04880, partial [Lentisphaerae bacterium]|nr:hypothetical protein [Lentisphaerota bacterium]